jgi:hypothetical protein
MARTDPAAAARAAMPERYGTPPRLRRVLAAVALVAGVLGALGWLLVVAVDRSTPDVAAAVAGFDVVSQQRTDIAIEIRRAVPKPVTCDVFAQAEDKSIVGERTVTLPTAAAGTQTVTVQIATVRRATTAGVRGCAATASDGAG